MKNTSDFSLLTNAQMMEADTIAINRGIPGLKLMENAGMAVAEFVAGYLHAGDNILVLCGLGNNGGDGFVAARILEAQGYRVRLGLAGQVEHLRGDAQSAANAWKGPIELASAEIVNSKDSIIVDALLGSGLARPIHSNSSLGKLVAAINMSGIRVVSVDVPSGLDGSTGLAEGEVVKADLTVTFCSKKPGHILFPGSSLCGRVELADIGIPKDILGPIRSQGGTSKTDINHTGLWKRKIPDLKVDGHKYHRGHVLCVGGAARSSGAIRLAARGALRIGAGLVSVACPSSDVPVYAGCLTSIMLQSYDDGRGLKSLLLDLRKKVVVLGPGLGVGEKTSQLVETALGCPQALILDADAITSFEGCRDRLFSKIQSRVKKDGQTNVVLTPHEGEFTRVLSPKPSQNVGRSKLDRARWAAKASCAVVVLKGADTVIADPQGYAVVNNNASRWLATAGSGDVLAGFIGGLVSQGMTSFDAACAAVWLHAECANRLGRGLISEEIPETLPQVLHELLEE